MSAPVQFPKALSPYAFANLVGKRPQMVYNYIKNGLIRTRRTETDKLVIDPEEMTKWATKWAEKEAKASESDTK